MKTRRPRMGKTLKRRQMQIGRWKSITMQIWDFVWQNYHYRSVRRDLFFKNGTGALSKWERKEPDLYFMPFIHINCGSIKYPEGKIKEINVEENSKEVFISSAGKDFFNKIPEQWPPRGQRYFWLRVKHKYFFKIKKQTINLGKVLVTHQTDKELGCIIYKECLEFNN